MIVKIFQIQGDEIPNTVSFLEKEKQFGLEYDNKGFYEMLGYSVEDFEELFQNKMIGIVSNASVIISIT